MESPLRFQLVVAALAVSATVWLTDPAPRIPANLAFQDPAIDESSGLVDLGGTLLTVNDSGDGPVVHVVDKSSGRTIGRTTYTADEVVDVEALSPGPGGTLWVGDIGDNGGRRLSVAVYELPMPGPGERTVAARRYDLAYRGGPRDAEALLVHPRTGRLYVVSKGLFGGQVFVAPPRLRADRPNVLRPVADVGRLVTDGAFFPDGRHAVLRSYSAVTVHDADRWSSVGRMELPQQPQGEGVAVMPGADHVLVSSEGVGARLYSVPLSPELRKAMATPAEEKPAAGDAAANDDPADPVVADDGGQPAALLAVVAVVAGGVTVGGLILLRRRQRRSTT